MKIQITENCLSTIDGFRLYDFHRGEIYDLREFVAKNLIHRQKAKKISLQIEVSHKNSNYQIQITNSNRGT